VGRRKDKQGVPDRGLRGSETRRVRMSALAFVLVMAATMAWLVPGASARGGTATAPLGTEPVPTPPNIADFVKDNTAAVKLGKALFWDMQAGSDGRTACATCHFNAGADNRSRNQLNPRKPGPAAFDFGGPNSQLTASDFPFHKLADPNDAGSQVMSDTSNVSGSQGVIPSTFMGVTEGNIPDDQSFAGPDPLFKVGGINVRRTTGRNTPSVINAVFNYRNFWDGRAQNDFNGVNPFGSRDANAKVGMANADGSVDQVHVSLINSSLASQADGPPGNDTEMSSAGRTLSDIGRKLMALRPLSEQAVSSNDSVLGGLASSDGRGLGTTYATLIKNAFQPQWWNSDATMTAGNGRSYSLMQFNFSLFWGLAIQSYEATLVSDQTPFDKFLSGDQSALSADAQKGMGVFNGAGKCSSCHEGTVMTSATVAEVASKGLVDSDGGRAVDTGFRNVGVRPTGDDPGNGGFDPFGADPINSLSQTLRSNPAGPTAVQGSFKVPGLRNVALTAPYFHNGGEMTLRQVVDFYSRGGDFNNPEKSGDVKPLGLSDTQKDQVVSFLESLTDPRVKDQSAPFDHPQLFLPLGEQTSTDGSIRTNPSGRAVDCLKVVPATGSVGGAALTKFPGFTGPPCDADEAPTPIPATGDLGSSSGSSTSASAGAILASGSTGNQVLGTQVRGVALRLSLAHRLRLATLRAKGLRLSVTVPANTRVIVLNVLRKRSLVAAARLSVRHGGHITVVWHPSASVLAKLKAGTYQVRIAAGPSSSHLSRDRATSTVAITG
jgi:cytochrome c peroxidase